MVLVGVIPQLCNKVVNGGGEVCTGWNWSWSLAGGACLWKLAWCDSVGVLVIMPVSCQVGVGLVGRATVGGGAARADPQLSAVLADILS